MPHSGRYSLSAGVGWLLLYAVLALVPMALALVQAPPAREPLVEFGVALGLLGLGMLALQAPLSGRLAWVAPQFGPDNLMHFHRGIGAVAFWLVLAHPVTLLLADPAFAAFLDPRADALRALALWAVTGALLVLVVTSFWRLAFGLSYELWRLLHGALAVFVVAGGLAHALLVDRHFEPLWQKAALVAWVGVLLWPAVYVRLVRPLRARRRPWRVTAVREAVGDAWSVTLRPDGHAGLSFAPGQYAWFSVGSPLGLQQHPFSLSSSARERDLEFTARAVGDFTSSLAALEPGTPVYVEGPLGSFVRDPSPQAGLFFVVGGIGITPVMSMLRTMRDDGDTRPVTLLYANPGLDEATFRDELDALRSELELTLVHVPEAPPEGWSGERGRIDGAMLRRHLPADLHRYQYLTCGPGPLMDQVEVALRDAGVDWRRIFCERFQLV